jgi:hypothetical protein
MKQTKELKMLDNFVYYVTDDEGVEHCSKNIEGSQGIIQVRKGAYQDVIEEACVDDIVDWYQPNGYDPYYEDLLDTLRWEAVKNN